MVALIIAGVFLFIYLTGLCFLYLMGYFSQDGQIKLAILKKLFNAELSNDQKYLQATEVRKLPLWVYVLMVLYWALIFGSILKGVL